LNVENLDGRDMPSTLFGEDWPPPPAVSAIWPPPPPNTQVCVVELGGRVDPGAVSTGAIDLSLAFHAPINVDHIGEEIPQ
jgi:hypothetical protein